MCIKQEIYKVDDYVAFFCENNYGDGYGNSCGNGYGFGLKQEAGLGKGVGSGYGCGHGFVFGVKYVNVSWSQYRVGDV